MYTRLVGDWLKCTAMFIDEIKFAPALEQQLGRSDLDTVCAFELYQMKKHLLHGNTLEF